MLLIPSTLHNTKLILTPKDNSILNVYGQDMLYEVGLQLLLTRLDFLIEDHGQPLN